MDSGDTGVTQWFEVARPARKKNSHVEQSNQEALFAWAKLNVKKYPGLNLMFASMNGAHLSGTPLQRTITGARMKRSGMKRGVPDVFLPVSRKNYHGLFIELKKPVKGIVSQEQIDYGHNLVAQGFDWHLCHGWEAAAEVIRNYYA